MKINKINSTPAYKGRITENKTLLRAINKSDYVSRCVYENILDRMAARKDGYKFELSVDTKPDSSDKKYLLKDFILRIFNKKGSVDKLLLQTRIDISRNKENDEEYTGVLKKLCKELKTFYPKKKKQKEEFASINDIKKVGYIPSDELSEENILKEEIHDDIKQFDKFFREDELFNKNLDSSTELNASYDIDDLELNDSIKSKLFDALF